MEVLIGSPPFLICRYNDEEMRTKHKRHHQCDGYTGTELEVLEHHAVGQHHHRGGGAHRSTTGHTVQPEGAKVRAETVTSLVRHRFTQSRVPAIPTTGRAARIGAHQGGEQG